MRTYPTTDEILGATILGALILFVGILIGQSSIHLIESEALGSLQNEEADYEEFDDDEVARCCTCGISFPEDDKVEAWVSLVYGDGRLPIYACSAEHLERRLITGG